MFLKIFKTFSSYHLMSNIILKNEIMFDKVNVVVPEVIDTSWKMSPRLNHSCYVTTWVYILYMFLQASFCHPCLSKIGPFHSLAKVGGYWHSSEFSRNLAGPRKASELIIRLVIKWVTLLKSEWGWKRSNREANADRVGSILSVRRLGLTPKDSGSL